MRMSGNVSDKASETGRQGRKGIEERKKKG